MIDVAITDNGNGGDFVIVNSDLGVTSTLKNQVYMALFGGNKEKYVEESDTNDDFWANSLIGEGNAFRSEFERTVMEVALNSNGLRKLKHAAETDLEYLSEYAIISVDISIMSVFKVMLSVDIKQPDRASEKVRILFNKEDKTITWQE